MFVQAFIYTGQLNKFTELPLVPFVISHTFSTKYV